MPNELELVIERGNLAELGAVLKEESDGKALRKDLARSLREAVGPAVEEARSAILGMASAGLGHSEGEPLRQAIARRTVAESRLSGKSTGVRVKVKKKGMPRGFENAAKRTQRAGGWKVNPYGGKTWVVQVGKVRWFDDALKGVHDPALQAVKAAIQAMHDRIVDRASK